MKNTPDFKAFATHHPFGFALLFFAISFLLNSSMIVIGQHIAAIIDVGIAAVVLQSLLALGVLARLHWLQQAGFNGYKHWRSLYLLWLPTLLAIFYLSSALVTPVASTGAIALALTFAFFAGLNEEAAFRGVILQALSPYKPLEAATLSALFFGLAHLNNLLTHLPPLIVAGQVLGGFLLGFGFAVCRLRTRTIWPLIIFHTIYDLPANLNLFAYKSSAGAYAMLADLSPVTVFIGLVIPGVLLSCYGLFLLHSRNSLFHPSLN